MNRSAPGEPRPARRAPLAWPGHRHLRRRDDRVHRPHRHRHRRLVVLGEHPAGPARRRCRGPGRRRPCPGSTAHAGQFTTTTLAEAKKNGYVPGGGTTITTTPGHASGTDPRQLDVTISTPVRRSSPGSSASSRSRPPGPRRRSTSCRCRWAAPRTTTGASARSGTRRARPVHLRHGFRCLRPLADFVWPTPPAGRAPTEATPVGPSRTDGRRRWTRTGFRRTTPGASAPRRTDRPAGRCVLSGPSGSTDFDRRGAEAEQRQHPLSGLARRARSLTTTKAVFPIGGGRRDRPRCALGPARLANTSSR